MKNVKQHEVLLSPINVVLSRGLQPVALLVLLVVVYVVANPFMYIL